MSNPPTGLAEREPCARRRLGPAPCAGRTSGARRPARPHRPSDPKYGPSAEPTSGAATEIRTKASGEESFGKPCRPGSPPLQPRTSSTSLGQSVNLATAPGRCALTPAWLKAAHVIGAKFNGPSLRLAEDVLGIAEAF